MAVFYGDDAKEYAKTWSYGETESDDENIDAVTRATKSDTRGCTWIWEGNVGRCMACGDMDFDLVSESEDA